MLEQLFNKIKKPSKKIHLRSLKRVRKSRLKMVKFSQQKDCYVLATGYSKCLDCAVVIGLNRMICNDCFKGQKIDKGVQYGVLIAQCKITKNRFKAPVPFESPFVSYQEIYKRIIAGDRFIDVNGDYIKAGQFKSE